MFEQISKFANETSATVTNNVNDTIKSANDTVASAVNDNSKRFTTTSDQVLDAVLDANRRIVDVAVTNVDRLNEQFELELPFADRMPTPAVAGERYLDFVERAVSINREMNQRVVDMLTAGAAKAPAEKTTAEKTTAKKRAAEKTTAKKRAAKKTTAKQATARKTAAKKATT